MTGLRELLIEERPFKKFHLYCAECDETIIELSDLSDDSFRNEVLMRYNIWEHGIETDHWSIHGNVEPIAQLKSINATITVNNNV